MFRSKSKVRVIAVTLLVVLLASCAGPAAPGGGGVTATPATPVTPAAPAPAAAVPVPPPEREPIEGALPSPTPEFLTEWGRATLDNYLPVDEIIRRAMLEEGPLVVYTPSSRTWEVSEAFMEAFPGLEVETHNISTTELVERFSREHDAGLRIADVVHVGDTDGSIWVEFVHGGRLHIYWPYDIVPYLIPDLAVSQMPMHVEIMAWFYNDVLFPDGSPITSWWDLTDPMWYGNLVSRHPLEHVQTLVNFVVPVYHHELMAQDYERVFGRPIELSPGAANAGYEWLRRIFAQNIIFLNSSADISTSVANAEHPMLGLAASSGLRRIDDGLTFNITTELTPYTAIANINAIYVTEEANNPYTAKLYIRFMTDYHGTGFAPFDTLGGWPSRTDLAGHPGNVPMEDIALWPVNFEWVYFNTPRIADYIRLLLVQ